MSYLKLLLVIHDEELLPINLITCHQVMRDLTATAWSPHRPH
jgi:hypothetical protein